MPFVGVKFEFFPEKNMFGKKTGKVYCEIGGTRIFAESREALQAKLSEFVQRAVNYPMVQAFHNGGEVVILHEYNSPEGLAIEYHKGTIAEDSPQIPLRCTGHSWRETLQSAIHKTRLEIAQQQWSHDSGDDGPEWLNEETRKEFQAWTAWQRRYKAEIDAGKTDHQAHAIACGLGYLLK